MNLSDRGLDLIANFEGFRSAAYKPVPTERFWTIGFGHYGPDVQPGERITREQGLRLLRRDAQEAERAVEDAVKVPVTQPQFDALVSLAFNIGPAGFRSSTVLARLNRRDYRGAAKAFRLWVKDENGNTLAGLVRRRDAEAALFLRGIVKPVRLTEKERYLLQLVRRTGVSERRRLRARDWLRHQAAKIQKLARREKGGWEEHDRGRRFRGIRKTLRKAFGKDMQ